MNSLPGLGNLGKGAPYHLEEHSNIHDLDGPARTQSHRREDVPEQRNKSLKSHTISGPLSSPYENKV